MKFGIMPHTGKVQAMKLTEQVISFLELRGISPWLSEETAKLIGRTELSRPLADLADIDILLVLGGDGTLLSAARTVAEYEVPILGVNVGHLGFLTELETDNIEKALNQVLDEDYSIEDRMFIEGKVIRDHKVVANYRALNDIVITRGTFARIIQLSAYVDSQHVVDYQADGIIVATPTGSTAYSLSAGGPIVEPLLDCLIITPICPHTLASRSVIVRSDSVVNINIEANHKDVMLTIDGQIGFPLHSNDQLEVVDSDLKAKFVRLHGRNFFTILNNRLKTIPPRKEYPE